MTSLAFINDKNSNIESDNIESELKHLEQIDRIDELQLRKDSNEEFVLLDHTIYRFKFTSEFMDELYRFSKIHQYDHRKDFKEAWLIWIDENAELVSSEIERMLKLNYEGDVIDKMFKSARYYFRKKTESTENKSKARRKYSALSKEFLTQIDDFIRDSLTKDNYQPKNTFEQFCLDKANHNLIRETIRNIRDTDPTTELSEIENKIKKTYKNRYRLIIK